MNNELSFDAPLSATVRLLDGTWSSYLRRSCSRLRQAGRARQKSQDSAYNLISRLKRTRPTTYEHCVRVAKLANATGRVLGFKDEVLHQLGRAAMLHDIGKILVPDRIIERPRKLNRPEQLIMQMHPTFGAMLVSYFGLPPELSVRTQHHHERWDGKGYPNKLGGEDIPVMARIIQIADTYDAMTTARPYRQPATHEEALAEVRKHTGTQFDPRMVQAFLDSFSLKQQHG